MQVQVIHGDDKAPLGISLVGEGSEDEQVLRKFKDEGMLPVSYSPREGLVVAFGHQVGADNSEDTEDDITPTEASQWAG